MKNNKKKAFTLAETLIVLTVLGVLVTVINVGFQSLNVANKKKIYVEGRSFYTNVEGIMQTLMAQVFNGDMTKVTDADGNATINSIDLKQHFASRMGGIDILCSEIPIATTLADGSASPIASYLTNASCTQMDSGIRAGFLYDATCKTQAVTIEYLTEENDTQRTVENNCGYIVYGFKNSKGIFGEDIFVIPIGKTRLN